MLRKKTLSHHHSAAASRYEDKKIQFNFRSSVSAINFRGELEFCNKMGHEVISLTKSSNHQCVEAKY